MKFSNRQTLILCLTLCGLFSQPSLASTEVEDKVLAQAESSIALADKIWNLAELGYQEQNSSLALQSYLKKAGFTLAAGVADIPTAFVASFGSGGPTIGILAEFDALPGLSQAAQSSRLPLSDGGAGHARSKVNDKEISAQAPALHTNDIIEVAGVKMTFIIE